MGQYQGQFVIKNFPEEKQKLARYRKKILHVPGSNVEMFKFSLTWILTTQWSKKKQNTCGRQCVPEGDTRAGLGVTCQGRRCKKSWKKSLMEAWRPKTRPCLSLETSSSESVILAPTSLLGLSKSVSNTSQGCYGDHEENRHNRV